MELYIRLQVQTIAAALALGAAAVLVYELLRTVRLNRRRRWVTHLTDGVYVLAAFWALLRFTLSIGQGELRLYVLPCAALGALLSRQLLAPFFWGVWQFWWGAAAQTGRWLCRPVILFLHFCKKVLVFIPNQRIIAGNAQFTGIAAGQGVGFTTGLLLLREGLGMRETPIRPHS